MNILNICNNLFNRKRTPEMQQAEKEIREGIANKRFQGQQNVKLSDLIPSRLLSLKQDNRKDNIFDNLNITYVDGYNVKFPYIDSDNVAFSENSTPKEETKFTKTITPQRIATMLDVPTSLLDLSTTEKLEEQFTEELTQAVKDKIIEVALSSGSKTDDQPEGLLKNVEISEINTFDDFVSFLTEAENLSNNMTLLASPKAKKTILTNKWFQETPFKYDIITDNRIEDGKAVMIDLRAVYLVIANGASITVDRITKAKDGKVPMIVEMFADWDIKANNIAVAKF